MNAARRHDDGPDEEADVPDEVGEEQPAPPPPAPPQRIFNAGHSNSLEFRLM